MIDLSVNTPPSVIDPELFRAASAASAEKLLALPGAGLYDQNGTAAQRETVAGWLARGGVDVHPRDLVFCMGGQQAIHLALADVARFSRSVASEAETYSGAIAAAAQLGLKWHAVAHDEEGMRPDSLDRLFRQTTCRAVFTTPICQNPLGIETSEARRREVAAVCRKHNAHILEDDIYAVYAAKGRPTYRELAPERTWYFTSFSKCLTPLLRLGVLVPPEGRHEATIRAVRAEIFGVSPTALALGCALIELGADGIAADRLRAEAQLRTEMAVSMLRLDDPPMPGSAPHVWLPLPAGAAKDFARRAEEAGVLVTPPGLTRIAGGKPEGVRLCILAPDRRDDLRRALDILAGLIAPA